MEEKVRLSDIASELGLSTATVSYVLHGKTGMVSERTAVRVRRALEERGYLPRAAEVLLAENPAKIVGVVINAHKKYEAHVIEDAFIASALNALSAETTGRGLQMMVRTVNELDEIIPFATMWNLEGLVLIGFCSADYKHLRENMRIPFVVYDACGIKTERTFSVNIDDRDGGRQVGEYFRRCGHRRALCLSDNNVDMDRERWEGFRQGFRDGAELWMIPMVKTERRAFYEDRLSELTAFTAVFAVSDHYAVDLCHFLSSHGIAVPDDISVCGFDDTPLCGLVYPALTSVRQDTAARAKCALDALLRLRAGEALAPSVTLPTELIVRGSTREM